MTTFTIGGVDLGGAMPAKWSSDGERARITGRLARSTLGTFNVGVYQAKGLLANLDEQAVAVIPSADPSLAGFYRVLGGGIDVTPDSYQSFSAPVDLELERLPGVNSPVIESRLLGRVRTNSHAIAVGITVPWWAAPTDAGSDYVGGATRQTRTGEGGSVVVNYTTDGTLLLDRTISWQATPGDYYDMAARVELGAADWVRLPGRQLGVAVPASTSGWRLNNGLVRVVYGGGDGLLSVQHYSVAAAAWLTPKIYALTTGIGAVTPVPMGPFSTVTIRKNAPEEVVIRLGLEQSTATPVPVNVDLRLRRGSLTVEGTVSRRTGVQSAAEKASISSPFGIQRNTAEAATSHTSGLRSTSADAGTGGGKYILTSPTATNVDLVQGAIQQGTGVDLMQWMISYEPPSASGADTFTNLVYSYFANGLESVRFARR